MAQLKIRLPDRERAGRLLKEKKYLAGIGGVILLVIVLLLVWSFGLSKTPGENQSAGKGPAGPGAGAAAGQTYSVLPETRRAPAEQPESASPSDAGGTVDPFAGPAVLRGVITGGGGNDLAIIEIGGATYVAAPGDKIAGDWTVTEIKNGLVILTAQDQEMRLEFNKVKVEKRNPEGKSKEGGSR